MSRLVYFRSVMRSCRCALWVLILLTVTTVAESAVPTVKVKLHDSAVLPCSERCPGLVRWTVFHKSTDVLAECDQTSCRSVEGGYQMIHDQYLKGDLSLTITGADFSKRALYTCECDGTDLCDVRLQIEALNTSVQVQPGKALVLDLDVAEPVEVVYNSSGAAAGSSGQICTVDGRSLQCRPQYSQRVSVLYAVKLRGVEESDGGVYTVQDSRNNEDIHVYTVSVRDCPPCEEAGVPVWVVVLLVAALVAVVLGAAVVYMRLKRENQQLRTELQMNKELQNSS
ncbi:uncharacterized protein [Salminus brasiliensis]|uniref:uncharacterized protein isoform X2 n=1 Tax=Salminus brasiliensis TaxID=930266 RepID=UPI003B8350E4